MAGIEQRVCIERKGLLELPLPCSSTLTDSVQCIIEQCLDFDPDHRPSFKEMEKLLNEAQKHKRPLDQGFAADLLDEHSVVDRSAEGEPSGRGSSFMQPAYGVAPQRKGSTAYSTAISYEKQLVNAGKSLIPLAHE